MYMELDSKRSNSGVGRVSIKSSFSLFLMRKRLFSSQKWFLRPYSVLAIHDFEFGTLPWHLVIRVKFGTCVEKWDFFWDQNSGLNS